MKSILEKYLYLLKNCMINENDAGEIIKAAEKLKNSKNSSLNFSCNLLGELYLKAVDNNIKKSRGQVFTPPFIVDYILSITLCNEDVVENPFVKIFDPSCGSGDFLIRAYDVLYEKFMGSLLSLKRKYKNFDYMFYGKKVKGEYYWQEENLPYHIIKNCIFGCDMDRGAACICKINLLLCAKKDLFLEPNIYVCDSLFSHGSINIWKENLIHKTYVLKWSDFNRIKEASRYKKLFSIFRKKYDYIIGNPPYVGHKDLNKDYKLFLKRSFGEVFNDKSDLSYCFIYKFSGKDILKNKLSFVTSRYFIESINGELIRKYLLENTSIYKIFDFYGNRIFKSIGIDPVIISIGPYNDEKNIEVVKLKSSTLDVPYEEILQDIRKKEKTYIDTFYVNKDSLKSSGFILQGEKNIELAKKIKKKCNYSLRDICTSFQGIITGCDKAFVIGRDFDYNKSRVNKTFLKPWLKNSDVLPFKIRSKGNKIIYSDLIEDEEKEEGTIEYIALYRERLQNRRECLKGMRKWYELQWGRNSSSFEEKKIIFPYKSESNRFALDEKGYYFSADVYGLLYDKEIDEYSLLGYLNSRTAEFYFKTYGKKLGKKMYDYYPNKLMELPVPELKDISKVGEVSKAIMEEKVGYEKGKNDINNILYKYFDFSESEIKIIEENI